MKESVKESLDPHFQRLWREFTSRFPNPPPQLAANYFYEFGRRSVCDDLIQQGLLDRGYSLPNPNSEPQP